MDESTTRTTNTNQPELSVTSTDNTTITNSTVPRSRGNRNTAGRSTNRGGRTPRNNNNNSRNRTKSTDHDNNNDEEMPTNGKEEYDQNTNTNEQDGEDSTALPSSDIREDNDDDVLVNIPTGNNNNDQAKELLLPTIIHTTRGDEAGDGGTSISSVTAFSSFLSVPASEFTVPTLDNSSLPLPMTTENLVISTTDSTVMNNNNNNSNPSSSSSSSSSSSRTNNKASSSTKTNNRNNTNTANTASKDKTRRRRKVEAKWVQCEKSECNKWRKLPSHMSLDDLPEGKWYCEFNYWDPERAFCDAPEESWDTNEITIDPPISANGSTLVPASENKRNRSKNTNDAGSNRSGASTPMYSDQEGNTFILNDPHTKSANLPDINIPDEQGNTFLNDDDDGPVSNRNKRRRDTTTEDDTNPITGGNTTTTSRGGGGGKRRNRTTDTPGPIATPTLNRKPTNPYVVTKPPLSSTGATLATMDRTNILPPIYVQGYRDYHNMMILHPIEVWADIGGGSGIFDQAIKGSWDQALSAGVNASYSNTSAPRVSWNELIAKSWNNPSGNNKNTTVIPSTVVTESHFRWNKSSMYNRPTVGSMQAHDFQNDPPSKFNPNLSAQDIARSGGKASVTKLSSSTKPLIPLVPLDLDDKVSSRASVNHTNTLSPVAQVALSLYTSSLYERKASNLPSKLLEGLQQSLRQTSYPASSVSTQPLRTSGPRETYYSSISHGIVMHTGIRISPLDVIGASISESSRWSSASVTLSQAITSMLSRLIQQQNKETKRQRRQKLRRQQQNTNSSYYIDNNQEEDDDEDDDDDDDFSLEYFGNHKMNEAGYLYRLPYDMYIQQTYQERIIFSLLLYFVLMVQLTDDILHKYGSGNLGKKAMINTTNNNASDNHLYRMVMVYEQLGNNSLHDIPGCTETFLTTILQDTLHDHFGTGSRLNNAVSPSGGIGPLAMKVRLNILVASGLIDKQEKGSNDTSITYYTVNSNTYEILGHLLNSSRSISTNINTYASHITETVISDYVFHSDRTFHDILSLIDTLYMEKAIKDFSNPVTNASSLVKRSHPIVPSSSTLSSNILPVENGGVINQHRGNGTGTGPTREDIPINNNNPIQFMLPIKLAKPWRGNE